MFAGAGTASDTITTINVNQPKSDYHYCDQGALDIPFRHEFKLAGTYRLPWYGIQLNAAIQSLPGAPAPTRWSISRTTRYAADCKGPCTPGSLVVPNLTAATYVLDLTPPGSSYYKRQNQVDLGIRKIFRVNKVQFSGQADVFNATNASYVKTEILVVGPRLGQPTALLQPRLLRLALQMRF